MRTYNFEITSKDKNGERTEHRRGSNKSKTKERYEKETGRKVTNIKAKAY